MSARSNVVVVGGGLVGACAALALAQSGFGVTLVDRRQPEPSRGLLGIDVRNVALSPASQQLLDSLGVWARVRTAPYHRMCVWEQWGDGRVEFDAAEVGRAELGWLVEMSPLVCAVWAGLEAADNVEVLLATIVDVVPDGAGVSLRFAQLQGETETARTFDFLVAADGAQSVVRKALDLRVVEHAMDQVALATVVRTARSHEHTAWQRFLTEGPLAFLPAPDEYVCSIVWSQPQASATRRLALDDAAFCVEIEHAIEHRLGAVTEVDRRFTFPLSQQRLNSCAPHARILLIGDAMRVVHPLAGLGVNLGLEDVLGLIDVARSQSDLSRPGIWQRYARHRRARSEMMIQTMSLLQKLYCNTSPVLSLLRSFGVQSFNALGVVKQQVMREAMGLGHLSGAAGPARERFR